MALRNVSGTRREITQGGIGLGPMVSTTRILIDEIVAHRHEPFQYRAVDRGAIHSARQNHLERGAMRPRFDDAAEKTSALAEFRKIGSHHIETGMGKRFVVCPRRAAEIEEISKGSIMLYDDIRKINRPVLIPLAARNRHREQFDAVPIHVRLVHVRKSAEPQDLDFAAVEEALALLPWNIRDVIASERGFDFRYNERPPRQKRSLFSAMQEASFN